jgi:pimeloyl-ACP methyl ester carboxylesterase
MTTIRSSRKRLLAIFRAVLPLAGLGIGVNAEDSPPSVQGSEADYVVLIHGLGRSALSMKRLEWVLRKQGYRVVNWSYPSTRLSVQAAAERLSEKIETQTRDPTARIHFVTHSLGGIVLRQYIKDYRPGNPGRVVMLAPPNQGSELADRLKANPVFKLATGPAGLELGTEDSASPRRLGPTDIDLGVIAGDRTPNPLFSAWIPGPDDGKVSVQSTRLDGMRDFLVVHYTHTWMMWRREVLRAVVHFLEVGRFEHRTVLDVRCSAPGTFRMSRADSFHSLHA